MSAFDRIQGYSAKRGLDGANAPAVTQENSVFDTTTPTGYFLAKLHELGYKMYREVADGDGSTRLEYTELHNVLTTSGDMLVLSSAGSGKALANTEPVLTETGYRPIGELQVGDKVFGSDLKLHNVVGVHPQGKKQINRITIGDTEYNSLFQIDCCSEHLWALHDGDVKETYDLHYEFLKRDSVFGDYRPELARFNQISCTDGEFLLFLLLNSVYFRAIHDDALAKLREWCSSSSSEDSIKIGLDEFPKAGFADDLVKIQDSDIIKVLHKNGNHPITWELTCLSCELEFINKKAVAGMFLKYDDWMRDHADLVKLLGVLSEEETDRLFPVSEGRYNHEAQRHITSIEVLNKSVDMTCITVDSPDHLFFTKRMTLTHNTTSLVFRIMLDILNGEATKVVQVGDNQIRTVDSIFVGTFLRTGAQELKERLGEWQRNMGYIVTAPQIEFGTLHAEFMHALNAMGVATTIGKADVLMDMLKESLNRMGVSRDGNPLSKEDYMIISSILTYYRGRLDNKRYQHPSCADYNLTPTILDMVARDFAQSKRRVGIMDFEDLQELLYKYLYVTPNPFIQDFIANRYKFIYLDEFQDTSQIQYMILKFYARGRLRCNKLGIQEQGIPDGMYTGIESGGKIIAVGDDDQCIYTWRGSDIEIINSEFERDFIPCLCELPINYRCPENVLNPIIKSIEMNRVRHKKDLCANKAGGEFKLLSCSSVKNMLQELSREIDDDIAAGRDVAIICRTNFDGMIPAFMLVMDRKHSFSISSENMTLSSALPRKIISVASLFTERSSTNVRSTLELFVPAYAKRKVKVLVDTLKNDGVAGAKQSIWTIDEKDIAYSCPEVLPIIKMLKPLVLDEKGRRSPKGEVDALRATYYWLLANVYKGNSTYTLGARAYIEALLYLLETKDFDTVGDFLEEIDLYNERLKARIRKQAPISVVTVHEFKGKERKSTYVWNDSNGVFPSSKTDIENEEQMEEERRVHYIACTRASEKNVILTLAGRESVFVKEMNTPAVYGGISGIMSNKNSNANIHTLMEEEEKKIQEALEGISFDDEIPNL